MANIILSIIRALRENPVSGPACILVTSAIAYFLGNEFVRFNARLPTLKGPGGWPVVGNIWDIRVNAAEKYRKWAKQYGSVYQIMLGNIPVVVINSAAAAKAIFGQNAQALSSRPELYTFHKVR